jgi:hypothetical protein
MPKSVTVTGDDAAARHLRNIARRAGRQRPTMEREGRAAQRRITGVPVDTGRLQRGVRGGPESTFKATENGYEIGTEVPYAPFVFGGTKHMAARPPKVPRDLGKRAAQAIATDLDHVR